MAHQTFRPTLARCYSASPRLTRRLELLARYSLCFIFSLVSSGFHPHGWLASLARAADINEVRDAFYRGDYAACIELSKGEVERGVWNDIWSRQLIEAYVLTGRYQEACQVYEQVAQRFSDSIPLRVLAAQAFRFAGEHERGTRLLNEIPELVQAAPYRFSGRDNMLAIGRYLLDVGEDARAVLDAFYDRSLKLDPRFVEAHVAIAELALSKADYQEAVKSLDRAVELRPNDPQLHYLLAAAWAPSDSQRAAEQLQTALQINPQHPPSLLMQAENLIDSEKYAAAEEILEAVFKVNSHHPLAWSQRAAIAHLRGAYQEEGEYRKQALSSWGMNPEVDYTIGRTLSQHYRFAEGVKYQRRALRMDPTYTPAKFQLAQDLLRSGLDDEGWSLVDAVAAEDKYNVVAFNLKTLQERLSQFTTLEHDGFIVRMQSREARIYGPRVLELLSEARQTLTEKYDHELALPITVEIFPEQSDFAIRTFGLPGGAGFLGVCFGSLITANSPASQGESPSNWESVLWHEFCHVVTLQKTNNRMPRWLSEGISVYEELERNPSWGQSMSPLYKQMLLGEDFVPLSQLSSAFMSPKSPVHLQFAYFESSLAVRYLMETHGLPLLNKLLVDLGAGVPLQEAFASRYGDTSALDDDFRAYVVRTAEAFLPKTEFAKENLPRLASTSDWQAWVNEHPQNYFGQRMLTESLLKGRDWPAAITAAQRLVELFPEDSDMGGGLDLLATAAREAGRGDLERETLERWVTISADRVPPLLRLISLCREAGQWEAVAQHAAHLLAVQPLLPTGHEALAEAAAQLERPSLAIDSLRALQEMEPLDPAGLHFQLAQTLERADLLEEARGEILLALEETPRYRAAQRLLEQIHARLHPPLASAVPNTSTTGLRVYQPAPGQPPTPKTSTPKPPTPNPQRSQ